MIRHIRTLKSEWKDKSIYIWDTGKKSVWVFSFLAYRRVNVSGFVTVHREFVGKTFMNRPVVHLEDWKELPDSILIFDEYSEDSFIRKTVPAGNACRLSAVWDLDEHLFGHSHYFYGTTAGCIELLKEFAKKGIGVKGFLMSEEPPADQLLGLPLKKFSDAGITKDDSVVITAVSANVSCDILNHMTKNGFEGTVYIPELISYMDIWSTDPFPMLDRAVKTGKRVLLCCEDGQSSGLIHDVLDLYGVPIDREVCLLGDEKRNLEDIYSLADEDPKDSVLLIHALKGVDRCVIVDKAYELGFSAEAGNYAGFRKVCYNMNRLDGTIAYERDQRLYVSIDYSPLGGKPGWALYGDESEAGKRIMVLGGSTSSELYYPENWVSKLYKRLKKEGIHAVIYNGAHEMEEVTKEMQRMCRDIRHIRPDIVISMSGVNDLEKKKNKFERWYKEPAFEFWRRNEQYMKLIAESEGAAFFAFLQPVNVVMPDADFEEVLFFINDSMRRGDIVDRQHRKDDFYTDLMDLFRHREGMFIDCCHYTDKANQEIADRVFETIREVL